MALATPIIAATYAEIALKGRNRNTFMRKLINNIRVALKGEPLDAEGILRRLQDCQIALFPFALSSQLAPLRRLLS